jgi:hypothetical protein
MTYVNCHVFIGCFFQPSKIGLRVVQLYTKILVWSLMLLNIKISMIPHIFPKTACIESSLPFCWRSLFGKKSAKVLHVEQWSSCKVIYEELGFLIYEEIRKYFPIYEEAVSHNDFATAPLRISLYMRKI